MLRKIIHEGDLQNGQRELFGEGGQRRPEASPEIADAGLVWRTIPPIFELKSAGYRLIRTVWQFGSATIL